MPSCYKLDETQKGFNITEDKQIIYIHKVRMGIADGWGHSSGVIIEILDYYSNKQKAIEAKSKRDGKSEFLLCDVGSSWIEEGILN